jgi:outer membrane receptor protein involved in Fe transport
MQWAVAQSLDTQRQYDLPAGRLVDSLNVLSEQSGLQIVYDDKILSGKTAEPIRGVMTAEQALKSLLQKKGLEFQHVSERTVRIRAAAPAPASEPKAAPQAKRTSTSGDEAVNMAEVLVLGSRSLNADIQRSINDPQPYVVFDRTDIERAGAINLNDFLLKRLSANTNATTTSQSGEILGDRSSINLRGLGEGQTLILVDGRRLSNVSAGFSPGQPNLNGIPLAAVERVEILPTTASAIYGGSATGGVINIILRRGYEGGEIAVSHDNSFDTDSSIDRIDFSYGFSLGSGRTSVMLNGSWSEANALLHRDRDFITRGLEHVLANNPSYTGLAYRVSTTPNIRSTTGVNLVLDDGTPLNSPITFLPRGYLGPASDGGAALLANAGRLNTEPSPLAYITGGAGSFGAIPRTKSFAASIRHSFTDRLDAFLDLSQNETHSRDPRGAAAYITLPANDPRNPFQQAIQTVAATDQFNAYSEQSNRTDRASAGLIARLPRDWAASLDFTWSKSTIGYTLRPGAINTAGLLASGFDPLIDHYNLGTLDFGTFSPAPISSIGVPVVTYSYNPTLRLGGPLWQLPGGPVTASFLLEQQKSNFGSGAQWNNPGAGGTSELLAVFPPRSQDVRSAYAEFGIPLFSKSNARPGLQGLDLQLAVRYDDYRSVSGNYSIWYPSLTPEPPPFTLVDNASAETTGLFGLKYTPIEGLSFRASHGTGFVPPDVTQLGAPTRQEEYFSSTPDPRRGNTTSPLPMVSVYGSNPNLEPEDSKTTSVGVIFEPTFLPGFRASLDYTRLKKTNNITSITEAQLLQYEDIFPERIQRGPALPDDQPGWAGPITFIDTSRVNAASARLDNLDMQLKYGLDLDNGAHLEFWGNGTWTLKAERQILPGLEPIQLRGISASYGQSIPLNFRGFYGVDFEKGGWGLGWTVRHYSSYLVADPGLSSSGPIIAAQGNGGRVPRQILHDLSLRWRSLSSSDRSAWRNLLSNMEVNAGIRNVFNREPEVDVSSDYTFYSYLTDARLRTYYLQLKYIF